MMSKKKKEQIQQEEQKGQSQSKDDFHNRFMEVLCTKPVAWWSEQLDVVPSLINARWKKGSYPNADNLIKICCLSGISANWLLLGTGGKYLENKEMDEDTRRTLQSYITALEDQNEEISEHSKKILNDVEILKQLKWFTETFKTDQNEEWITQLKSLSGDAMFNRVMMPNYIFLKMLVDIIFKSIEHFAASQNGQEILTVMINWIQENYTKNLYHAKGSLKDLDTLFNKPGFKSILQDD